MVSGTAEEAKPPTATVGLEALADAVVWFATSDGDAPDIHQVTDYTGHSGPGWYASSADYPDEGSVFITGKPDVLAQLVGHFAGREAQLRHELDVLKRALGEERVRELLAKPIAKSAPAGVAP